VTRTNLVPFSAKHRITRQQLEYASQLLRNTTCKQLARNGWISGWFTGAREFASALDVVVRASKLTGRDNFDVKKSATDTLEDLIQRCVFNPGTNFDQLRNNPYLVRICAQVSLANTMDSEAKHKVLDFDSTIKRLQQHITTLQPLNSHFAVLHEKAAHYFASLEAPKATALHKLGYAFAFQQAANGLTKHLNLEEHTHPKTAIAMTTGLIAMATAEYEKQIAPAIEEITERLVSTRTALNKHQPTVGGEAPPALVKAVLDAEVAAHALIEFLPPDKQPAMYPTLGLKKHAA
jgi:hypothetical protein